MHLLNANVYAAAKKAYKEKRLTAQHKGGRCQYSQTIVIKGKKTECFCAIGAAFTRDFRRKLSKEDLNQDNTIQKLEDLGKVSGVTPEIRRLQIEHDGWATAKLPEHRARAKLMFLEALKDMKPAA